MKIIRLTSRTYDGRSAWVKNEDMWIGYSSSPTRGLFFSRWFTYNNGLRSQPRYLVRG